MIIPLIIQGTTWKSDISIQETLLLFLFILSEVFLFIIFEDNTEKKDPFKAKYRFNSRHRDDKDAESTLRHYHSHPIFSHEGYPANSAAFACHLPLYSKSSSSLPWPDNCIPVHAGSASSPRHSNEISSFIKTMKLTWVRGSEVVKSVSEIKVMNERKETSEKGIDGRREYGTEKERTVIKYSDQRKSRIRSIFCISNFSAMFSIVDRKLRRLSSRFRWPLRRFVKPKIVIRTFGRPKPKPQQKAEVRNRMEVPSAGSKPIRIATFNAAMFSMALVVPKVDRLSFSGYEDEIYQENKREIQQLDIRGKSMNDRPKSILKQVPATFSHSSEFATKPQSFAKSKLRVSINLPDNEISIERNQKGKSPTRSVSSPAHIALNHREREGLRSNRTILEVLREVDADIVGLQDVKADEEKGMKPLSDLADALGMKYVFAESWAPEYGNAVLSRWPIKKWKAQKIFDDTDFRNVLKVTVDVPHSGEVNFHCTHLDHLAESWRMKQIDAIIQSDEGPHILAGGLNSLDGTDYSTERWSDIVKYYEEIGKPTPKVEVMKFLKERRYVDAKDFAGECESVVMIVKGQDVQGTCKYGTRVDYILASTDSPYKFVPGSYSVLSSKGTSDHHIVTVSVQVSKEEEEGARRRKQKHKKRLVTITKPTSRSIWRTDS
ncbi:uncharacterized protein [Aristolochia californica]|uniref:uncharacterized protein n=1 Tax=Aristolochia californica TaxID=171875 RepID=UPI0035E143CF